MTRLAPASPSLGGSTGESRRAVLAVGATRDKSLIVLLRGEERIEERNQQPVAERNDLATLTSFLERHHVSWANLDRIVALQPATSKTTVRVLTTLLATTAWYHNRPLVLLPVETLDELSSDRIIGAAVETTSNFDPNTLGDSI